MQCMRTHPYTCAPCHCCPCLQWLEARGLAIPQQLSQLPHLRQLLVSRGSAQPHLVNAEDDEQDEDALPPGDWLGRLTHLAVSLPMLLTSVDRLRQCNALRHLSILRVLPADGEWRGLAGRKPLRGAGSREEAKTALVA